MEVFHRCIAKPDLMSHIATNLYVARYSVYGKLLERGGGVYKKWHAVEDRIGLSGCGDNQCKKVQKCGETDRTVRQAQRLGIFESTRLENKIVLQE